MMQRTAIADPTKTPIRIVSISSEKLHVSEGKLLPISQQARSVYLTPSTEQKQKRKRKNQR
jgi:hypothetical protein